MSAVLDDPTRANLVRYGQLRGWCGVLRTNGVYMRGPQAPIIIIGETLYPLGWTPFILEGRELANDR